MITSCLCSCFSFGNICLSALTMQKHCCSTSQWCRQQRWRMSCSPVAMCIKRRCATFGTISRLGLYLPIKGQWYAQRKKSQCVRWTGFLSAGLTIVLLVLDKRTGILHFWWLWRMVLLPNVLDETHCSTVQYIKGQNRDDGYIVKWSGALTRTGKSMHSSQCAIATVKTTSHKKIVLFLFLSHIEANCWQSITHFYWTTQRFLH